LAFDATGRVLACAHDGGVTLWDGATPRTLACDGTPIALAWRPDGGTVAAALQQNAWAAWRIADGALRAREACPNPPGAVRFSADGHYLATSNTGAILCWRFDPPDPVLCGIASRVPAGAVAWHPRLAVLAAGYDNGAVTLCQPGSADVLFVREANGDPIDMLAWSADGAALALGSRAGEAGVVALPDQVFRGAVR
jgi:WD40 repeat protein